MSGNVCSDIKKYEKAYKFSIACNCPYGDKKTTFISCICFRVDAVADRIKKGDRVVVVGELRDNSYENKEGKKVRDYILVLSSIQFCDRSAGVSDKP